MKLIKESYATKEQLQEAVVDGGSLKGFTPDELAAILQALSDKKISFAQLPDYMFQISEAKRVGMNFDTMLTNLKNSVNADELGGIVYDFEQNGNNQLRKVAVGESMNESVRESIVIDPYNMDSCELQEGDEIELSRDLPYAPFDEVVEDWYYDEGLSEEQIKEKIKSDYNMILKEYEGDIYATIAKGTKMKLIHRFSMGGGWPEFQINDKETLDFAGEAFRAYRFKDSADLEDERTFSLTQYQIKDLQKYINRFEYSWDEVYEAINSKVKREGMSVEDAIDEVEEDMVAGKSCLYESTNQLKDFADEHKKKQKGSSPFTRLNAGNVEKGIAFFNHVNGTDACASGECMGEDLNLADVKRKVGSEFYAYEEDGKIYIEPCSPLDLRDTKTFDDKYLGKLKAMNIDFELSGDKTKAIVKDTKVSQINVRQALNDIDKSIETPCFVNLYDSCKLTEEEKLKIANMITSDDCDLNCIYEYLLAKSEGTEIPEEPKVECKTEELKEEIVDYTAKFTSGQFTTEELIQLREDIVFGSLYTSDYNNRFNINPKLIQDFFEGFESYITEAKSDPQPEDDLTDNGDNINMLAAWYNIMDYSDADPDLFD